MKGLTGLGVFPYLVDEGGCSNVSSLFEQVNVEQKKGFPVQEEPNITNSGSLRKSMQTTESRKDCSEEENKPTSVPEPAFLVSEKRGLLKRKGCLEEARAAEVPCKLLKKGMWNWGTISGIFACIKA